MFVGGVVMVAVWIICAFATEISKVHSGYLTYENRTYTVTLYDELEIPGEEGNWKMARSRALSELSIRDKFQVAAFHAFYKAARIGGKDVLNAFVSSIVKSSDGEVERILANDPDIIQRWFEKRAD